MSNNRTRTIGIIIAVILGLAVLLYLGGLVCQLLTENLYSQEGKTVVK